MKRLALILSLLSSAAYAGPRKLPPPEYDHPYTGKLTFEDNLPKEEIGKRCRLPSPQEACAIPGKGWCHILMAPLKDIIAAVGVGYDIVWRHEVAHCNGWPEHHPNAREAPWYDSDPRLKKPESEHEPPGLPAQASTEGAHNAYAPRH